MMRLGLVLLMLLSAAVRSVLLRVWRSVVRGGCVVGLVSGLDGVLFVGDGVASAGQVLRGAVQAGFAVTMQHCTVDSERGNKQGAMS